jgi:DNA-binding transcriptional LysR family regulator
MLVAVFHLYSLDQLQALLAVVDEGSFSAAARRLRRVQSAVSTAMASLERHLGVTIWDRATRIPTLTEEGRAVVAAARRVCAEADALGQLAAGMAAGIEAAVSLCVDALMPVDVLVEVCRDFRRALPAVDLRVDTQTMRAVSARVRDGSATLGVVSPLGVVPGVESRALAAIRMVPIAAPGHPLAAARAPIPTARFAEVVQIVLSERSTEGAPDQAVLSPRTWRVADLHTKHALLRAGLGWGNLPEHVVRDDLRAGRLVELRPRAWSRDQHRLQLSAIYRADAALGPAHRWMLDRLSHLCGLAASRPAPRAPRRAAAPRGGRPAAGAPRPRRPPRRASPRTAR